MPMDSISICSNTLYMSNMDAGSIILTPFLTKTPKIRVKEGMYNCLRLILNAYGQHINVFKHCVYVEDENAGSSLR